jgi:hypothetical protein
MRQVRVVDGQHPDEIRGEFTDAGMPGVTRYAVEGGAWLFAERDGWLQGDHRTTGVRERAVSGRARECHRAAGRVCGRRPGLHDFSSRAELGLQ